MSNSVLQDKRAIAAGSVLAMVGVLALTLLTTSYYPATGQTAVTVTTTTTACPKIGSHPTGPGAPAAGWIYYLQYNASSGKTYGLGFYQGCYVESILISAGLMGSTNVTAVSAALNALPGNLLIEVNGYPYLDAMTTNGYINAFYVDLQTHQVTLIPGVTFSNNYENAYYNGQSITNGTQFPVPGQ